jgi:hypothetical protein
MGMWGQGKGLSGQIPDLSLVPCSHGIKAAIQRLWWGGKHLPTVWSGLVFLKAYGLRGTKLTHVQNITMCI